MKQIWDAVRQQWVAATPEEIVRQRWLHKMIHELQFPPELLAVERELKMLPHLAHYPHPLPSRRIDILSFGKNLAPLFLIECKAGPLVGLEQLLAYNTFVQAPCVAIVNHDQILFIRGLEELTHMPTYAELADV